MTDEVEIKALRERYRQLETNFNKAVEALKTIAGTKDRDAEAAGFMSDFAEKIVKEIEDSGSEPTK